MIPYKMCVFVLVVLVAGVGCGDDEGGNAGSGSVGSVAATEFCVTAGEALNDFITRCNLSGAGLDPTECQMREQRSIESGVIAYDADKMGECIDTINALDSCRLDFEALDVCDEALKGTLGDGEVCYFGQECDNGYCNQDENQCPGACVADAKVGESCTTRFCTTDTFCNNDDVCQARLAVGAPCPEGRGCEERAFCDRSISDAPVCAVTPEPVAAGGACDQESNFCAPGLFCLTPSSSAFGEGGVCTAEAKAGESCMVGGNDLEWFYSGCFDSICNAEEGATSGTCIQTNVGDACITRTVQFDENSSYSVELCSNGNCNQETMLCEAFENTESLCVRP